METAFQRGLLEFRPEKGRNLHLFSREIRTALHIAATVAPPLPGRKWGFPYSLLSGRNLLRCSRAHPAPEQLHLLLGPGPVAGHGAIGQPLVDVLGVLADVVVRGKVENERRCIDVLGPEERTDVPREAGRLGTHSPNRTARATVAPLELGATVVEISRLLPQQRMVHARGVAEPRRRAEGARPPVDEGGHVLLDFGQDRLLL